MARPAPTRLSAEVLRRPPEVKRGAPAAAAGRERILRAALRLFAEEGFEAVSVRRIAAEANVAFSLIRIHFGSKAGLQAAIERAAFEPLDTLLAGLEARVGAPDLVSWAVEEGARLLASHLSSYAILRRAVLSGGRAGDRILEKYLAEQRRTLHALSAAGIVSSRIDLTWASLIQMFVSLGPVLAQPFVERIAAGSLADPRITRAFKTAWAALVTENCGERDDILCLSRSPVGRRPKPGGPVKLDGYGSGRERLLHAALSLVTHRGWPAVSLRQIGEASGLSFALIRIHFGSKDDLRTAVDAYVMSELEALLASIDDLHGRELLDALFSVGTQALAERSELYEYLARSVLEGSAAGEALLQRYYNLHRRVVSQLAHAGAIHPNYDRIWTPLITMFAALGPALFGRFVRKLLGRSFAQPCNAHAFKNACRWMLTWPLPQGTSSETADVRAKSR